MPAREDCPRIIEVLNTVPPLGLRLIPDPGAVQGRQWPPSPDLPRHTLRLCLEQSAHSEGQVTATASNFEDYPH